MPVYDVVQVTCSFIIKAFLRQKQFQGMWDRAWSEAGHDYGQKIHCCVARKTLNDLGFFFFFKKFKWIFFPSFCDTSFLRLDFSGQRRSQIVVISFVMFFPVCFAC